MGGRIDLTWADNARGEIVFLVERSADGSIFTTIARTPARTTRHTDTDVEPSRTYWYRARAANFDGAWVSDFSNVASASALPGR